MSENENTGEESALIIWPTSAIEGAMAERDRLLGIIDRAAEAIRDSADRLNLIDLVGRDDSFEQETIDAVAEDVRSALAILAEADPDEAE